MLERFFKMQVGKDYKVISFQGEAERIAALVNGDIQGALMSTPRAPQVMKAGLQGVAAHGDYMPRAGGTFWTMKSYVDKNPETVKKFIRAIARGVMSFRNDKEGSVRDAQGASRHQERRGSRRDLG